MIENIIRERTATCGEYSYITETAQQIKGALYNSVKWRELPYYMKEGLDMIAHKLARITNGDPYYRDHWEDIIGYSTLIMRENGSLSNSDKGAL